MKQDDPADYLRQLGEAGDGPHDIARAALKLGPSVTVERIDGALHDVFLSRREARAEAYERLGRWVTGWAATPRR